MTATPAEVLALYPALHGLDAEVAALAPLALAVPPGTVLFNENEPCKGFPLLLEGEVRVSRNSPDGRSLELYRLVPGELCLASSACLFRTQMLAAQAVATRPTRLLLVPPATFRAWLAQPAFRDFVLGLFADRMADLAALVDEVAFQRTRNWRTYWGRCARSSRGCCGASSARAGSSWRASASASAMAPPSVAWRRLGNPGHRRTPAALLQWATHLKETSP
jgi:hypothetical protein